jgi:four helix bundle protein
LRGRSYADFVSKIGIVEEEADETLFWIDMAIATELVPQKLTQAILAEADELVAIVTATRKTGQARKRSRNNPKPRQPEAGGPPQQAGET